jgi:prepilin-type N-terminal cleavage/methylation domain-containing protein
MENQKSKVIRAFTLVELLVVIAIISILATLILSAFRSTQARSRDGQRKSDLKEISHALEMFYSDHKVYPADSGASGEIKACPWTEGDPGLSVDCVWGEDEMRDSQTTYFRVLPTDPIASQKYFYNRLQNGQAFQLFAHLENEEDRNCIKNTEGIPDCTIDIGGIENCGENCNFAITSANVSPEDY